MIAGSDDVHPKADWSIIAVVERQPGDAMLALGNPLAEGRRLAESGRRGDERELARLVEANSQARARDPVGPRGRDIQLGREERG